VKQDKLGGGEGPFFSEWVSCGRGKRASQGKQNNGKKKKIQVLRGSVTCCGIIDQDINSGHKSRFHFEKKKRTSEQGTVQKGWGTEGQVPRVVERGKPSGRRVGIKAVPFLGGKKNRPSGTQGSARCKTSMGGC